MNTSERSYHQIVDCHRSDCSEKCYVEEFPKTTTSTTMGYISGNEKLHEIYANNITIPEILKNISPKNSCDIEILNKNLENLSLSSNSEETVTTVIENNSSQKIVENLNGNLEENMGINKTISTSLSGVSELSAADNLSNSSNEEIFYDCLGTPENDFDFSVSNNNNNNLDDTFDSEKFQKIRRSSSLKAPKKNSESDTTPAQKKIVRFADALGLDLADVRTFLDDIPSIPKSAYDDLQDVGVDFNNSSPIFASSSSSNIFPKFSDPKFLIPMFQQPYQQNYFWDKIRENNVCLENATVPDDCHIFSIKGIVRVRNLDFYKSVFVRYSMDNWCSFSEIQANYISESCDGFSDQFSFTIYLYNLFVGQRIEIAVRFQCLGTQFWDNNNGSNYVFQCLANKSEFDYNKNFGKNGAPTSVRTIHSISNDLNLPSSFY